MCRLLAYLGARISLDQILLKPEHSLLVQSYQPLEMTSGVVNADGFGLGWYQHPENPPFVYRHTLPIWSDENLEDLSRYIQSSCILASIRSATAGQPVQLSNCQPFRSGQLLGIHNGFIENFRHSLYRPIRDRLSDPGYQMINGTTDSEHIFALICEFHHQQPNQSLAAALRLALATLIDLATEKHVKVGLNLVISDGRQLVASRCAYPANAPSLYWLQDEPAFARSRIIASEPLFASDRWQSLPENSLLVLGENLEPQIHRL